MSIGKKSIVRAVNAAAKADAVPEKTANEIPDPVTVAQTVALAEETRSKSVPDRFRNVRVGDNMPAFLL